MVVSLGLGEPSVKILCLYHCVNPREGYKFAPVRFHGFLCLNLEVNLAFRLFRV
uniref:Uncharacterized protein n=1 Tax=Setaria italica TaxID=4555 RepID=K3YNS1_SETIT